MKMKEKIFSRYPVVDYFAIIFGAALMGLGIGVFLIDAKVVPGGVSGLAMAIHYLTGNKIPVGMMIWAFNIPLFIWGVKSLGRTFGARTFVGFSTSSFFIDFFRGDIPGFEFIRLQDSQTIQELLHGDFLFLILIGASLLGLGLGIIFKFKGSTAGSDIVAAIMQKKYGIKPGQAIMFVDFFVIAMAGIVIHMKDLSPDRAAMVLTLYAVFLLFISAKIIDIIIDGFDYARMAYIISDKNDEISEVIQTEFSRGITALKSRGVYKEVDRDVLVAVVTLKEVGELTDRVKSIDPDAFLIISNVHEIQGNGFRRRI